jgi:hypothetical protein
MNYIEREIEGLRPDVALIGAMPERPEVYQYTARLLRASGNPRIVLPTHWDRFNVTYDVAQDAAVQRLQTFVAEVKAASPDTKVVVPAPPQLLVHDSRQPVPRVNVPACPGLQKPGHVWVRAFFGIHD